MTRSTDQWYGVQSFLPGPVSQLLRVDLDTGSTTVIANFTDVGLGNVAGLQFVPVPEPSTLTLLGLGTLGLLGYSWRRRKRAA